MTEHVDTKAALELIAGSLGVNSGDFYQTNALPANLGGTQFQSLFSQVNLGRVDIPFLSDNLYFFDPADPTLSQGGYSFNPLTNEAISDWPDGAFAFGFEGGDPFLVLDGSDAVYWALHGVGSWSPVQFTSSVNNFLAFAAGLAASEKPRNGEIWTEDEDLSPEFLSELSSSISALGGDAEEIVKGLSLLL